MEYALAVVFGILYGGAVGVCKYLFLWRKALKTEEKWELTPGGMYSRMTASYAINVATLLLVYFLRNIIPFDFVIFAISTALALSLAGKAFSLQKVYKRRPIQEKSHNDPDLK